MTEKTREPQYQCVLDIRDQVGFTRLGLMSNQVWHEDPRALLFHLARYKFVSKMFAGFGKVLEVGCADAFNSRVVQQSVKSLVAVDFDPVFVRDANERMTDKWRFECVVHDMVAGPFRGDFDGAYALDVLEHIPAGSDAAFVANMAASLAPTGSLIVGTPSLQSQAYASAPSREGHINCKDAKQLKELMQGHFHSVFIFSMNDEVVHTGYYPMANYLLALCAHRK